MKKNLPKIHTQKGFTLLETLVAIFILTLSITGPVYIASVAFHNTIDSRDNISAQYIAEEVVEVVRNKRDGYTLTHTDGSDWLSAVTGSVPCANDTGSVTNKCTMLRDSVGGYTFQSCTNGLCGPITFDPEGTGAVYGKEEGTLFSKFTREFYFESLPGNQSKEVTLTVNIKWEDKGRPKIYTLVERLYPVNYKAFFKPESN